MDGNSNPDGAKKKGGGRFWGGFLFPFFVKTVKLKEKKRGGSECHQTPINKKNHNKTEPAANRVATQGEIRSSPAFFL